jgi:hypothetical protein
LEVRFDNVVADLKVIRIKQWIEKTKEINGNWLLRRPRLTQGCSAERKDGSHRTSTSVDTC